MLPDYGIVTDTLELDAYYDITELGEKAGHLNIYVYDKDVSEEKMAEILLGIKDIFLSSGVKFYAIDCVLEYPRLENHVPYKDGRVEVSNFLCEDIYEEGLTERVAEANRQVEEYHAQQDALKQQEIEAYQKALEEQSNNN